MESCDVLIVGGGPAGSTCAWKLRKAGLDVIVLDKKNFPRDKTCAGWITPAVVDELQLDIADYADSRIFQPIAGFRTGTIGGRVVDSHYDKPVSFGIRRCEFDDYLLRRSGARLRLGERIESIERSRAGSEWIINGSILTPMLIGAGGHFCPVARSLSSSHSGRGNGRVKELVVAAQEIEFEMSERQLNECAVQAAVPELYFCSDLMGYAWCFRKGNVLNVGLGREDNVRLTEHVSAFCELMKRQNRIPIDMSERFHGHAYILYGHTARNLVDDRVLLIGDAAGLAYPQSGEGIRPAVESAMMAAEVIASARGDYKRETLQSYVDQITKRFGSREPKTSASAMLPRGLKEKLAAWLLATHWFSRHVVIDRWFLHAHEPAFV